MTDEAEDLRSLYTDPKHQRRGAGHMLVQWGVNEAARLRLPMYLESTATGHELYKSCGFRDVEELNVDMTKYGGDGIHTSWAMRRDVA